MITVCLLLILGALIGNYITSLVYRIPRKIQLCGFHLNDSVGCSPMCSVCHHELHFWEFLPILSWISCRNRCNYCNAQIPKIYFYIEFFWSITLPSLYLFLGASDNCIAVIILLAGLTILFGVTYESGFADNYLIIIVTILAAIYQLTKGACLIDIIFKLALTCTACCMIFRLNDHCKQISQFAALFINILELHSFLIYIFFAFVAIHYNLSKRPFAIYGFCGIAVFLSEILFSKFML